ncbi:hypothetical protein SLA2020_406580 [Shorea laevis]
MGNSWACFSPKEVTFVREPSKRLPNSSPFSPFSTTKSKSKKKANLDEYDDALIQQQAQLAAALLFQHHQQTASLPAGPLNRSTSVVFPSPAPKKIPRSSSSGQQSRADHTLLLHPHHQLVNKDVKIEGLETKRFVLVHGGGFGAWCWYKTITLLEEATIDILEKLGDGEKVILVGHDFGGACISYVMELFPSKISKAIFVTAAMLSSGQSTLDMFSQQTGSNDLMQQAQAFLYANGKDQPPTAIDLDKALVKDLLFNQSPAKDVSLALVSMRPVPFAPVMEKLSLSEVNYGSVRRFYVVTQEDCAIPVSLQEKMVHKTPPEEVFWLKGSDHAPFFSRPQSLHKILVEISQIPPKHV